MKLPANQHDPTRPVIELVRKLSGGNTLRTQIKTMRRRRIAHRTAPGYTPQPPTPSSTHATTT